MSWRWSSRTCLVRSGAHLLLPSPPEFAHLFLVVGHRSAAHSAGNVVVFDAAAGVTLLAGLQCLKVVGRGEPAGTKKRQEAVEPALPQAGQFVARGELPGGDIDPVRRRREQG